MQGARCPAPSRPDLHSQSARHPWILQRHRARQEIQSPKAIFPAASITLGPSSHHSPPAICHPLLVTTLSLSPVPCFPGPPGHHPSHSEGGLGAQGDFLSLDQGPGTPTSPALSIQTPAALNKPQGPASRTGSLCGLRRLMRGCLGGSCLPPPCAPQDPGRHRNTTPPPSCRSCRSSDCFRVGTPLWPPSITICTLDSAGRR